MKWAKKENDRITATPGDRARCPACGGRVIAKCGEIKIWHWAHKSMDCDPWHEPETQWHLQWKNEFPDDWQEVVIGNHRADVKTPKTVVEFQSSPISGQMIRERENFYGRMVWLINGQKFRDNMEFRRKEGDFYTFRWKHPRKTWWESKKPIFIDFGSRGLFQVCKIHPNMPCGGWGSFVSKEYFLFCCGRHLKRELVLNDLF